MKIPDWVPKEGVDYLAEYHKSMTALADSHPIDEEVLRQKIQVLERLAISEEIRTDAVEPLKQMGFTRWRDFYGVGSRVIIPPKGAILCSVPGMF
ncbi:hypothetical protein [Methylomarinovum caldicuralii]|uniref:hypothetical protein n=1 Tax=Methylomarinovum caldicuralii TaxID=438856 RepID=UPI002953848D|nr:hypothetical protein [Methylomarinovum caldicuralii]